MKNSRKNDATDLELVTNRELSPQVVIELFQKWKNHLLRSTNSSYFCTLDFLFLIYDEILRVNTLLNLIFTYFIRVSPKKYL